MDSSRKYQRSGFPLGTFQGFLTQRSSWKRLIDCIRGVTWIADGVPPGHVRVAPLEGAWLDPSVTVTGLAGAAAQTTATVEGTGVANTPKTFADVGLRPASVVVTMKATVAPGMSVAQEPQLR